MQRIAHASAVLTSLLLLAGAGRTQATPLPTVGCPADGMAGPAGPPSQPITAPALPGSAPGLAYYASEALAVLAPQGWHCIMIYDSGGTYLFVTPEDHHETGLSTPEGLLVRGDAIVVSKFFGYTSGRFEVAQIAARLFPAAKRYVQNVIDLGFDKTQDFPFGQYCADHLTHRTATIVEFTAPGGKHGIGTSNFMQVEKDPVLGAAIWLRAEDDDMLTVQTRLPASLRPLSSVIIQQVETSRGKPTPPIR